MKLRVLRSIHEIPESEWDALCGGDVVFRHAWFRMLEASSVVNAEPRHLVLESSGRVVALLPCFVQHDDPYQTLLQRVLGPLAPYVSHRALVAYSPLAQRTELFLADGVSLDAVVEACCEAMDQLCDSEGIALSGWPFVRTARPDLERALDTHGYRGAFLAPSARWQNAPYPDFDAYVERFKRVSRRRYKDVRHELNRFARSGVELCDRPLADLSAERLAELQSRHYARHNAGASGPFGPAFFSALIRELGDAARVHSATRDGELLSYSIVLCGADRWHMFLSGDRDPESAHADKLHFNLNYYFPIQRAIECGTRWLDYGLSSYETKVQRGCGLEPLRVWVRAHAPLLRTGLPAWLSAVDWHYRRKHAHLRVDAWTPEPLLPPRPAGRSRGVGTFVGPIGDPARGRG